MAGGATAGGFAAGFARGLANTLLANKQEATRKRERQEEVDFRNFQTTLPIVFQNFQQNPTPEGAAALEDMLVKINPDLKKQIKRSGFSFETLGPLLSQLEGSQQPGAAGSQQQPSRQPIPEWLGALPQQNPSIGDPSQAQPLLEAKHGAMVGMPDPTVRLFGAPVQTADQRLSAEVAQRRKLSGADIQAQLDMANRLLETGAVKTMAEALDRAGLRQSTTASMRPQSVRGVLADGTPAFGVFDPSIRGYINPDTGERLTGFRPLTSEATQTFGVDREALSMAMFDKPFRQLEQAQAQAVIQAEQKQLEEESRRRRLGTGQGAFESPIDLKTAQDIPGARVGTSSADYAGQTPPTQVQAQRRETAGLIKDQLDTIKPLLTALPSEKELGGLLPGAANAARRRLPAYRNQYAQLESAINNIRASLTRTMQQNVGTETEQDASRALSTIADFEGALLDPAKGDTQESALARLQITLDYLDKVMKTMPGPVVPNANRGAATAAPSTPAGRPDAARPAGQPYQDERGNWVIP